jgi:dolichol-phosphate mannosyltransferase
MANRKSSSDQTAKIAVVIPCHRERLHILDVLAEIGPEVAEIFVIDDACPDDTGTFVEQNCKDDRVHVVRHGNNQGVGGATLTGYQEALTAGCEILVKLDGDGQMNPVEIPRIAAPVAAGRADYAKGNRFHRADAVANMPQTRLVGNIALSLMSKLSSGYWNIFDPTNGFTAIHSDAARNLPMDQISKGYFFESELLFRLGMMRAVVEDVPMTAQYGEETSGINIPRIIPEFFAKHTINTCKRMYFNYFLRDPGVATLQLVIGTLLSGFGVIFGSWHWYNSIQTASNASAGTVVLAALPIIVGLQLLFSFFGQDVRNVPNVPLQSIGLPSDRPRSSE